MKVCYWGTYDKDYSRNKIILSGLRKNGAEVVECHTLVWKNTFEKIARARTIWFTPLIIGKLVIAYIKLCLRFIFIKKIDIMILGYSGHFDVFIAKILSRLRRIPLVFDAFLSLYDTVVMDRKIIKKGSLKSKILWWVDKYSCKLADLVLLDTNTHIDYFCKEYGLPKKKFRRILIGADDSIFRPTIIPANINPFIVLHFGMYIPLHGMSYIIRAAKELEAEDVYFKLIGTGDEYVTTVRLAHTLGVNNVEFIDLTPQEKLADEIRKASVCLGVFGDTEKTRRIIPNKVYESMAARKPVITGDTQAVRELFTHEKDIYLCATKNAEAIVNSIRRLKSDVSLSDKIAENGYQLYRRTASPEVLGAELKSIFESFEEKLML